MAEVLQQTAHNRLSLVRPRSANASGPRNPARPNAWGRESRSKSEPPSSNRVAQASESSDFSSARSESRSQHGSSGNDGWFRVLPPLGDNVMEVIEQIPNWEDKLTTKKEENKDNLSWYWRDVDKKISALLHLMNEGISESNAPDGWKPYSRALRPLSLREELGIQDFLPRLQVGTLIDIAFHNSSRSKTTHLLDPKETQTICGPVYTKIRTVIIVGLHRRHADCVPIYSHNGKGLANKSEEEKGEFVAVQNEKAVRWWPENGHGALEATPVHTYTNGFLTKKSYVKYTERVSHYYSTVCNIAGKLEDTSKAHLLSLVGWNPNL